jgi:hypothetical protein
VLYRRTYQFWNGTGEGDCDGEPRLFKGIEIEESSISPRIWYYGENLQKLVWDCTITGKPKDNVLQGGNVIIDAVTGEVISRSRWL